VVFLSPFKQIPLPSYPFQFIIHSTLNSLPYRQSLHNKTLPTPRQLGYLESISRTASEQRWSQFKYFHTFKSRSRQTAQQWVHFHPCFVNDNINHIDTESN
jgi:hypothetical protein